MAWIRLWRGKFSAAVIPEIELGEIAEVIGDGGVQPGRGKNEPGQLAPAPGWVQGEPNASDSQQHEEDLPRPDGRVVVLKGGEEDLGG